MEGVLFDTSLNIAMIVCFMVFYVKNKDQRIPIFALMVIAIFWAYFSYAVGPQVAALSGSLFYMTKAITDLFSAVLFMVLYVNNEEANKNKFPLSKYLAYIFWANFSINVLSAIEFNTSYAIMYNMYGGAVTLLNISQVLILFKGIQDYVSRPRKSNHNLVFNRAKHDNSHVGFPDSSSIGKENTGKETKK